MPALPQVEESAKEKVKFPIIPSLTSSRLRFPFPAIVRWDDGQRMGKGTTTESHRLVQSRVFVRVVAGHIRSLRIACPTRASNTPAPQAKRSWNDDRSTLMRHQPTCTHHMIAWRKGLIVLAFREGIERQEKSPG